MSFRLPEQLYDDMMDAAKTQYVDISVILRRGLALYLKSTGYDRTLRLELEAADATQRLAKQLEARLAASERAKSAAMEAAQRAIAELAKVREDLESQRAKKAAKAVFKSVRLQEAATNQVLTGQIRLAVRMWQAPETRRIVQAAVEEENAAEPRFLGLVGPPALRPLRGPFGGYAGLVAALVEETGVSA